ncbi:hypothetical protein, partial [Acidithiobacillus caldus]
KPQGIRPASVPGMRNQRRLKVITEKIVPFSAKKAQKNILMQPGFIGAMRCRWSGFRENLAVFREKTMP